MNCQREKGEITDYISGQLNAVKKRELEAHLTECASCHEELEAQQHAWNLLGSLPVAAASHQLDEGYRKMIDDAARPPVNRVWRIAAAVILVVAGFSAGWIINRPAPSTAYRQQVDSLSLQVREMREMMLLSLLENPSASERIRAVSYTSEISTVNAKVIDALMATLNNDPNVNVRLLTLEALTQYIGNAAVREGLIQSIVRQQSPLVQSAMADVMLKIQEKRSVQPFKKLLEQKQLNRDVRTKIEETISRLI